MESRKVQITGGSTYIVSLPKSWVKEMRIQAGDPVWITPRQDGVLLLSPKVKGEKVNKKKVLEIGDETGEHLIRKLIGMYIAGYNTIEIKSRKNIEPEMTQLEEREKTVFQSQADAPNCPECGSIMVRNGNCYKCIECGTTSGCS